MVDLCDFSNIFFISILLACFGNPGFFHLKTHSGVNSSYSFPEYIPADMAVSRFTKHRVKIKIKKPTFHGFETSLAPKNDSFDDVRRISVGVTNVTNTNELHDNTTSVIVIQSVYLLPFLFFFKLHLDQTQVGK